VTFSGGEPLMQPEFVAEVMRGCREHGIHTAMETSLFADWSSVELVLPHLSFLFADLKVMDEERHRLAAGVSNQRILDNLKKIQDSKYILPIHVRIPLIPGINDDEENLRAAAAFCDPLTKVEEIELLPYHRLGLETYRLLGREYELSGIESPSPERMEALAAYMNGISRRVRVRVGG